MMEKPAALPVVFLPLVANALYSSRLVPGLPRLKDIPVMKNVVVAISWALVCTLLPAAHMGSLNSMVFLTIIFMTAKSFINTVLYDIRDLEGDRESGVRTIPVLLGPANAFVILLAVNSALLSLLLVTEGLCRMMMAGMILYGYAYILYFRQRRNPILLDLFVDGEWILACVLVCTLGWGFGLQA
jgi:4-hydroxybenzoate polyprenyltransferase